MDLKFCIHCTQTTDYIYIIMIYVCNYVYIYIHTYIYIYICIIAGYSSFSCHESQNSTDTVPAGSVLVTVRHRPTCAACKKHAKTWHLWNFETSLEKS